MMIAEKRDARRDGIENRAIQPFDRDDQAEPKKLGGLVLARQLGESIMIGESVMVEVIDLKSNTVRLRIVAPRSIAVHRREVFDAIRLAPRPDSAPSHRDEIRPGLGATTLPTDGGLILTRRSGQTIMIGDEIAIDVVEARPGTVRLRVIAPRSITVHRREVYDAVRAAQSQEDQGGDDSIG